MPSRPQFDPSHPNALALYCSDGRFTDAVEHLLHGLGFPRLDTLTIPGGPGLLEMMSADSATATVVRKSLSFLVKGHAIKHVVLVAHQGCGYYKERFRRDTPEALVKRQIADLGTAEKWLRAHHAGVAVTKYFAAVRDGRVVFDAT
jgi:hypothetical protein